MALGRIADEIKPTAEMSNPSPMQTGWFPTDKDPESGKALREGIKLSVVVIVVAREVVKVVEGKVSVTGMEVIIVAVVRDMDCSALVELLAVLTADGRDVNEAEAEAVDAEEAVSCTVEVGLCEWDVADLEEDDEGFGVPGADVVAFDDVTWLETPLVVTQRLSSPWSGSTRASRLSRRRLDMPRGVARPRLAGGVYAYEWWGERESERGHKNREGAWKAVRGQEDQLRRAKYRPRS